MRNSICLVMLLSFGVPAAATAAPTPAQRCEADVELASAKYAQCRLVAESRFSKDLDAARRATALARCSDKLLQSFERAALRYGASCTSEPVSGFDQYLAQCSDDVAAASVAGGSLPACGDGVIDVPGEQCDDSDLGGASCASLGFAGGALACDGSCSFDTASCQSAGGLSAVHQDVSPMTSLLVTSTTPVYCGLDGSCEVAPNGPNVQTRLAGSGTFTGLDCAPTGSTTNPIKVEMRTGTCGTTLAGGDLEVTMGTTAWAPGTPGGAATSFVGGQCVVLRFSAAASADQATVRCSVKQVAGS